MSEIIEVSTEMKEVTPIIQVPITITNPKTLTYEERQEAYNVLRQYEDYDRLPLPEEFWDNDPFSERGLIQLEHDAHIVGLLNKNMLNLSAEKEQMYRTRLAHKIALLREARGLGSSDGSIQRLEGVNGMRLEGCAETGEDNTIGDQSALE
jgi:hypothetical protein